MILFLQNITPPQAALIAAFITWLLTQITEYRKRYREDIRVRKEILFFLIQFHKSMKKYPWFYEEISYWETRGFTYHIQEQKAHYEKEMIRELSDIKSTYANTVQKFATVDPIMANELLTNGDVPNYFDEIIGVLKSELLMGIDNEKGDERIIDMVKYVRIKTTFSTIVSQMRKLSWKIGPFTYLRVLRILRKGGKTDKIPEKLKKQIAYTRLHDLEKYVK